MSKVIDSWMNKYDGGCYRILDSWMTGMKQTRIKNVKL